MKRKFLVYTGTVEGKNLDCLAATDTDSDQPASLAQRTPVQQRVIEFTQVNPQPRAIGVGHTFRPDDSSRIQTTGR